MKNTFTLYGGRIKGERTTHESGCSKLAFKPFNIADPSRSTIEEALAAGQAAIDEPTEMTQIYLQPTQTNVREILEQLGFKLDGIEYSVDLPKLLQQIEGKNLLPSQLAVRSMIFETDMTEVVALEKLTHRVDPSSRVSFETELAIEGMKNYYHKRCQDQGAFLLTLGQETIGTLGFMAHTRNSDSVHLSSISIIPSYQGKGLFFPFVLEALRLSPFADKSQLVGTTSTERAIQMAKRYGFTVLGLSLSRRRP